MGSTPKHINQLIKGSASITKETALKLERVLGSTARFWLNREAQYREALARQDELKDLESAIPWLKEIPVSDMARFGWINTVTSNVRKVYECLQFFRVASVEAWKERYGQLGAGYRASKKLDKKQGAVSAWLCYGEIQAERKNIPSFNKSQLKAIIPPLRKLSLEAAPSIFLPTLSQLCESAGIVVVVSRTPKGCPISGATKWLCAEKALMMLSFRHKSNDHFWFTFFHEIAHLLLHGKRLLFLEELNNKENKEETEADQWAKKILIPPPFDEQLPQLKKDLKLIKDFAQKIGVAPGIVVGRMQHDKLIAWNELNNLKVFYEWKEP